MNFTQLVNEVTRLVKGTCLDHIYSNRPLQILIISTLNCGLYSLFLLYADITTSADLVACRKIRILDIVT